jgi:signal transduction histidine kinase
MQIPLKPSIADLSRLKLAILYSVTVGSILLFLGFVSHRILLYSFSNIIDHELDLLSVIVKSEIEGLLKTPGELPLKAIQTQYGICSTVAPCSLGENRILLIDLVKEDRSLRLVNLEGIVVGAIGEPVDRFSGSKNTLALSYTDYDQSHRTYHFHRFSIKTISGKPWGYLQIGRSVQQLDDYMAGLHLFIFLGIPLSMVMIGGTGWWFAGRAMAPVYESYAKMKQFTIDASHELRTPIAATQAILELELCSDRNHTTAQNQVLQSLKRQNDRLGKLTRDLLFLSRLDLVCQPINIDLFCLNDLIQDLDEEIAPLALTHQVELVSQCRSQSRLYVKGDSSHLYRLLSNLICNAIHYTPSNGRVVIELVCRQNQAFITVQDTGIGISSIDLPHLFDRFYRVNSDRSQQTGGVGLGLSIAQSIVKAHNGQIHVQSTVGKGSIFTVRLPLQSPPGLKEK